MRKENRLDDGSVVGSYGWVDANGILRLYDYIADDKGYRIVKTKLIDVKKQQQQQQSALDIDTTQTPIVVVKKKSKIPVDNFIAEDSRIRTEDIFGRQQDDDVSSARLQRRISTDGGQSITVDVQPIFDFEQETDLTTLSTPPTVPTSIPIHFDARGEGFRTPFNPTVVVDDNVFSRPVARSRSEDGRQLVVVKRRRPTQPYAGSDRMDYQTRRAFHLEETARDGKRVGQYGYIDPIGVRRVVNYSTGDNGEIVKSKENDFVGRDTYFEAS